MRRTAAVAAGRTGDSSVEAPLRRYAEDHSSAIRSNAFMALVVLRPGTYLTRWFEVIMDVRENTEFRIALAEMEFVIPREVLRAEKAKLMQCLDAALEDRKPLDKVRVRLWVVIAQLFQEEPVITLSSRSRGVISAMRDPIEMRIMRTNFKLGPAEVRKEVDQVLEKLVQVR